MDETLKKLNGWDCFCEVEQLQDEALKACQTTVPEEASVQVSGEDVYGWCYIDPSLGLGSKELVANCSANEQRKLRIAGQGKVEPNGTLFIACATEGNGG